VTVAQPGGRVAIIPHSSRSKVRKPNRQGAALGRDHWGQGYHSDRIMAHDSLGIRSYVAEPARG